MVLVRNWGAPGGLDEEAAIVLLLHHGHFLPKVERRAERLDLLEQGVRELLAGAHRHGRNVVDRLVGIELHGLAAGVGERVDHMGLDLEQAEFEHLEQANRAGTDDDGIGFNGAFVGLGGFDHFLTEFRFHGLSAAAR